jgi:hypothetical protein
MSVTSASGGTRPSTCRAIELSIRSTGAVAQFASTTIATRASG